MSRKKRALPGQMIFQFVFRRDVLRKLQTGDDRVMHLLRVIDDHAGDSTDAWLKVETIASEMCASIRSTERAIAAAVALELLLKLPRGRYWRCRCGMWNNLRYRACGNCEADRDEARAHWTFRTCNTYRLKRHEMAARAGVRRPESEPEPAAEPADQPANLADCSPEQPANLADTTRQSGGSNPPIWRTQPANMADTKKPPLKTSMKPSTNLSLFAPPNPRAALPPNPRAGWDGVVEGLLSFGCRDRPSMYSAIRQAQANDCEPSDVEAIIAHALGRQLDGVFAWGPGAVLGRIASYRPGDDVDAFWPPPHAEFQKLEQREKSRAASESRQADLDALAEQSAQRSAEFHARQEQLELRHGKALDALDEDQRKLLWRQFGYGQYQNAKRFGLLEAIANRRPIFVDTEK